MSRDQKSGRVSYVSSGTETDLAKDAAMQALATQTARQPKPSSPPAFGLTRIALFLFGVVVGSSALIVLLQKLG